MILKALGKKMLKNTVTASIHPSRYARETKANILSAPPFVNLILEKLSWWQNLGEAGWGPGGGFMPSTATLLFSTGEGGGFWACKPQQVETSAKVHL